ncbi:CLUMA_CG010299, isoform A [Clunio marinus]|uniref:[histone H3]-lysine(27) N-trimethyltransferase n=1 Tax=Clunio marinus TaxID=568069 RepID=A0A1J1I9Z4_9DIPT|nr:CLUMA_CG010299, isoform A [Clunio marinus]
MKKNTIKVNPAFEKRLREEYNRLKQPDLKEKEIINMVWKNNRTQCLSNANEIAERMSNITCTFIDDLCNPDDDEECSNKAMVTSDKKKEQSAPVYVMTKAVPLPRMSHWSAMQQNFKTEDETFLNNYPNLDEAVLDNDPNFMDELVAKYDGKFHDDSEFELLDDKILVELVKAMIPYQSNNLQENTQNKDSCQMTTIQIKSPSQEIFVAISKIFESGKTADEIREKYIELTKVMEPKLPSSNIDGPDADSLSFEQSVNSYQTLFCRRCFKFDCYTHDLPSDSETNFKKRETQEVEESLKPCSKECYKIFKKTNINNKKNEIEAATSSSFIEPDDVWTGSDQSLFRVLRNSFSNNYCAIARGLQTKTCQQVYQFSLGEPLELVESKLASSQVIEKQKKVETDLWKKHFLKDASEIKWSNYTPCDDVGECGKNCSCFAIGNCCEKYCNCSLKCSNRYPGCSCKGRCNTKLCGCRLALRECDPDVCKCDARQPDNDKLICDNVNIQRGLKKHLLMAISDVVGWGIFLKAGAKANEFISEYCGEIISQEEADRRGAVYDKQNCSYLFNLNNEYSIDATRKGNKIRFANHSERPNCYAKIFRVNGDHRIGIFAKREIQPGEELFLHYSEHFIGHF